MKLVGNISNERMRWVIVGVGFLEPISIAILTQSV